jgi:hypothetical protein
MEYATLWDTWKAVDQADGYAEVWVHSDWTPMQRTAGPLP